MRNRFTDLKFAGAIIAIAVLSAVMPTNAAAQNAPPANQPRVTPQPNPGNGAQAGRGRGAGAPESPSAPAPVRDFNGMWAGGMEALISNRISPMTPAGKAKLDANIPDPFSASSNDPWKTCDPFGMPRSVNNQTGQLGFATMPGRIILMSGFNRSLARNLDGRSQASRKILVTKGRLPPWSTVTQSAIGKAITLWSWKLSEWMKKPGMTGAVIPIVLTRK